MPSIEQHYSLKYDCVTAFSQHVIYLFIVFIYRMGDCLEALLDAAAAKDTDGTSDQSGFIDRK